LPAEQRLTRILLRAPRCFGELDAVTSPEILADLTRLTGSAP
jgi:hypothetical protein